MSQEVVTSTLPSLDVGVFDQWTDSIVIEGIRYSGSLFRNVGVSGLAIGQVVRITGRDSGKVSLQVIDESRVLPE